MSEFTLTPEQKEVLRKHGEEFKTWIKTEKGKGNIEDHREHERYFKQKLSAENLSKMTEDEFADLYKKLWASNIWGNKDWYVQNKLIGPNGLQKIKDELKKLLYGEGDIVEKWNNFRNNVSGFGASSLDKFRKI
jgi:hypothetical protein